MDHWAASDAGRFVPDSYVPGDPEPVAGAVDPDNSLDNTEIVLVDPALPAEPAEVDALTETPLGLLGTAGRRRRGEGTAGGFASRLRRRRSEENAEITPELPPTLILDETEMDH